MQGYNVNWLFVLFYKHKFFKYSKKQNKCLNNGYKSILKLRL